LKKETEKGASDLTSKEFKMEDREKIIEEMKAVLTEKEVWDVVTKEAAVPPATGWKAKSLKAYNSITQEEKKRAQHQGGETDNVMITRRLKYYGKGKQLKEREKRHGKEETNGSQLKTRIRKQSYQSQNKQESPHGVAAREGVQGSNWSQAKTVKEVEQTKAAKFASQW
jgi:hypothetical protein